MARHKSIRIFTEGPMTMAQLEGLRAQLPKLSEYPPSELRDRLSAWPICVLGSTSLESAGSIAERLVALGLRVELFDFEDYSAEYVRHALPPPPELEWERAEATLELVFRPAFSPEVVLRLWSTRGRARLQVASLNTSIWVRRFNAPPWLTTRATRIVLSTGVRSGDTRRREPEVPKEEPNHELVELGSIDDVLALAAKLPPAEKRVGGLDGMYVEIRSRIATSAQTVELWSPRPERAPEAFELLRQVHRLAWTHVQDAQSRRRLEELHSAIGLGLAMEDLGGVPRAVRLWGGLALADEEALGSLLGELTTGGGVLDLSEVPFIAGLLVSVFQGVSSNVHFVVPDQHRELLSRAGVQPANMHATRARAVQAGRPSGV